MTTFDTGRSVSRSELQPRNYPQASSTGMPDWRDRARYEKARRLRRLEGRPLLVDATGTHRRLRALMAIGWRARDLAPRIGWASGELDTIFRRPTVRRGTALAVAAVYDQLADTPGPSAQTVRRAARAGYPPPLWWDDDTIDDPTFTPNVLMMETSDSSGLVDQVAIDRYLDGDTTIRLRRNEKVAALAQLVARGYTVSAAGAQLHMSGTVTRQYAARAGLDVGVERHDARVEVAS